MTQHLSDMHQYMRLVETGPVQEDEDLLVESISTGLTLNQVDVLMEDLGDVIFKLKSYRELDGSQDYALGVEEGLQLAADMLARLVEAHSG